MGRHYKINGWQWASVTTIISDCSDKSAPLMQWAANQVVEWIKENCNQPSDDRFHISPDQLNEARFNYRNTSKDALEIGSAVHAAIEHYLKTGKDPQIDHEKVLAGFVAFLEWKDENDLEVIAVEETVSGKYWAGTLDLRCKLNGKKYVIDFKTSKKIYPADMGPQIAAYRSPFDDVVGCGILRLDKETGLPEWKDFTNRYEQDLNTFNKMVELYYARHKINAKKAGYKEK